MATPASSVPRTAASIAAPIIVWFRDDLRISDNPALNEAVETGRTVLCVFIHDEESPGIRPLGGAAKWWLAGSLRALTQSIATRGGALVLRKGNAVEIISSLARQIGAAAVHWNRRYDAAGIAIDDAATKSLAARNIPVRTFQASLLYEPRDVRTLSGGYFTVFTPFWRQARARDLPRAPLSAPTKITGIPQINGLVSEKLEHWKLEPNEPDWAGSLRQAWKPGEGGARQRAEEFLMSGLPGYAKQRDRPDLPHTSRLSPHLRFGEISPFQLWHAARLAITSPRGARPDALDLEKFLSEIGAREFSYHLLHHNPNLGSQNFQPQFDRFPWTDDSAAPKRWRTGQTGYPIIDAGMRELWTTGWMHNRLRMLTASFLVKHMLVDWRIGEAWFWDTLVDADIANNPYNWQWVAGSGADAAPYFRIFNPVMQGETYDPAGGYVRRFVPELAEMPKEFIHEPWRAPAMTLRSAGVTIGVTYPEPAIDHRAARDRALAAFAALKPAVA
jgi:deoxyribodipyrimidine photo-lyase